MPSLPRTFDADLLIVGGGTGGCAAAMAATNLGLRVILTEETDWLGGQLTSQLVPPDECLWIEGQGCTLRYRRYRELVRQYYRDHFPLTPEARASVRLNPGKGAVSHLCHEPRVGLAVIEQMLAWPRTSRRLDVRLRCKPVGATVNGDAIESVTILDLERGTQQSIRARYFIDATELGELLPLAKVEYVSGAESKSETGELHAIDGPAQPDNVQALTWCMAIGYDPAEGADYTIPRPRDYAFWRDYVPQTRPPWSGKLIDSTDITPATLQPRTAPFFEDNDVRLTVTQLFSGWWSYRRVVAREHFPVQLAPHEVTIVNWPQNDYFLENIIDRPEADVRRCLEQARQLSLSLLYWLQTERPRPDGGTGYPGLYLRPDIAGTSDGLAKAPYIRESRRIRAQLTVTEAHVGTLMRGGWDPHRLLPKPPKPWPPQPSAEPFPDSIGLGSYRIDLHPSTAGNNYIDISSLPFQIPLGAVLPVRVRNLLPACKNIGTTHITNGCYRLHPVEWNIGESVALLAAFCTQRNVEPHAVRAKPELLADYQRLLSDQGVQLEWLPFGPR